MHSNTPNEDSGRGTLSTAADRSNRNQKKSSRRESLKKETKKKEEKKWSRVPGYTIPVIISFILQLGFLGYTAYEVHNVAGNDLLFLIGFVVVALASLFITLEIILVGSKLWIILSTAAATLTSAGACILIVVKIQDNIEQEQYSKIIQQLASILIIVMTIHLLVLCNYYFSKFDKKIGQDKNKKSDI